MDSTIKHRVVIMREINEELRHEVAQLAALGEQHDGAEVPYYFEPSTAGGLASGCLFYIDGELVGFAAIQHGEEPEISGMIHPAHRCKGLGRMLLAAVRDECREHGIESMLLTTNEAVASGAAFAMAMGGAHVLSEYRMELDPATTDRSRPHHDALRLRQASATDIPASVHITAAAFGDSEDEVREFVESEIGRSDRRFYLAELEEEPIGSLRVSFGDEGVFITTFGVLPEQQGHGYGRQILIDTSDLLLAEGVSPILLEVATANQNALGVYQACGFRETAAYGYYRVAV